MHYRPLVLCLMITLLSGLPAAPLIENTPECELNEQVLSELIELQEDVILRVEGQKVFLRSEQISSTDHGLLLNVAGKCFRIPQLYSEPTGCYTLRG